MPRRAAGLTVIKAKNAAPGRYADGNGLHLLVRGPDAKFWLLRYTPRGGKQREMGLGRFATDDDDERKHGGLTLRMARERASELRAIIRAGGDPIEQRRVVEAAAVAQVRTDAPRLFSDVVEDFLASREAGWKNAKHAAQWAMTLKQYAGPHMGKVPVRDIDTTHVLAALQPLWSSKSETASRLRGRIENVLDFARVKGWREGENPARWKGHLAVLLPAKSKVAKVEHHSALDWREAGAFIAALRAIDAVSARALEFAILTAARTGEVIGATWGEIDIASGVWTVPASRMKAGREHRVALSKPALAVLAAMAKVRASTGGDALVFPGQKEGAPLSSMALLMLLRRMADAPEGEPPRWRDPRTGEPITAHGFRSSFREWAGEATHHPREVIEHALAHGLRDKVEAAYQRGDLFEKRRVLMDAWATFLAKKPAGVTQLRAAEAAG
ncbi:integrase arm-type DNA-binding domain-containing protein [Roseomonas sp. CAU 1739]|uniref:tyrosine-type recombinase/integrase n=1 Tax=Roseomonas sp. CAU 1739 TaxID=3140364 RepID=UPI00325B38A1